MGMSCLSVVMHILAARLGIPARMALMACTWLACTVVAPLVAFVGGLADDAGASPRYASVVIVTAMFVIVREGSGYSSVMVRLR